jgi:hypothetical protein
MRGAASLVLGVALALAARPAGGEIYRCKGPDGKTIFTSDAAACPGTLPHAPSRDVQRVDGAPDGPDGGGHAPGALAGEAGELPESDDAQAAMWKRKRVGAEVELAEIDRSIGDFREVVTWCNRGGDLVLEDKVGVREEYSCEEAQATYDKLSRRQKELRRYLNGGLEDECRRAGCLPGWIR